MLRTAMLDVPAMTHEGDVAIDYEWNANRTVGRPMIKRKTQAVCSILEDQHRILVTFHGPDGKYHVLCGDPLGLPFVSRFLTYERAFAYGFITEPLPMCDPTDWRDPKQGATQFLKEIGSGD